MITRRAVMVGLAVPFAVTQAQRSKPVAGTSFVTIIRDVAYRAGADSTQRLDFYRPGLDSRTSVPAVLFVHGGSLTSGDRRDPPTSEICGNFSNARIACVSVNYRLVQQAKWPAQPQDVAAAIAWVLDHADSLRVDPRRVFVFGHSSGCHLASVVATDTTYLAAYRHSPRDLGGVVAMGCLLHQVPPAISDSGELRRFFSSGKWIFPSLEAFREADPTLHVGPHVPPTLILIAESEQKQPPILANAQLFAERMRGAGRPVDIEILPNRLHMTALSMMEDPLDPTFMRIAAFVSGGALR